MTTANPTLLQSLNQFGVDLAFWDLTNAQDINEIEANLRALAATPQLPPAVAQALELALVQLPTWSTTAQSDPSAAMDSVCQWYSQTELLCAQGIEPVVAEVAQAADTEVAEQDNTRIELHVARDGDLLREFCNEANELLADIEQGLLTLESTPDDHDVLNAIFRAFHTFKGGAGMLKLLPIQHLAHQLESILDKARKGLLTVDSNVVSLVLQASDGVDQAVRDILQALDSGEQQSFIAFDAHAVLDNVARVLRGDNVVVTAAAQVTQPDHDAPSAEPVVTVDKPSQSGGTAAADVSIKVGARKLDELIDLVGELMIAQSMVTQHPLAAKVADDAWNRSVRQLSRITKDLQRTTMAVRMVPVANTFKKMTRVVRDLSAAQGKQIDLVLKGEYTELDRSIVDALADPLAHMVRNAVDHGIEPPDERQASGKDARGRIELAAFQRGGAFWVQITDDGRGLSRERIRNKALANGLITPDQELADADLFNLIFAAGFSTATNVTNVSGRGVGMDVVRQSIAALRGKVDISSELGQGTQMTITLPLTLAIIDGLLVVVGQQRYIVPALSVIECLRPQADMLGLTSTQGEVVRIRDQLIPIVRLGKLLDAPHVRTDPTQGIVVVVQTGRQRIAILVDQLLDKQELVIKSLGSSFQHQHLFSGAAVMGDGLVSCILNIDALSEQVTKRPASSAHAHQHKLDWQSEALLS
ncbi:chemotaxis protein CheA [Comamonadaceae bacterium M7527]|nr:chemotaxis protein CheA [Comamonadaceae bacterium M7527]